MTLLEQLGEDLKPEITLEDKAKFAISKFMNPDSQFFNMMVNAYMLGYRDKEIETKTEIIKHLNT